MLSTIRQKNLPLTQGGAGYDQRPFSFWIRICVAAQAMHDRNRVRWKTSRIVQSNVGFEIRVFLAALKGRNCRNRREGHPKRQSGKVHAQALKAIKKDTPAHRYGPVMFCLIKGC
jgi:hypothetical protein